MTRYNDSAKVSADRRMIRQNTDERVDLIAMVVKARKYKDADLLLEAADMYAKRKSKFVDDGQMARRLRIEAGAMKASQKGRRT